ncbi:restriction endonuclease subunit S [Mycoplasma phocimorsus]|nr:restriction endonuclease subunit S [Mycoplasma phocimorsus]MDJ1649084.1 restriction endonuclease subunit S [Mycoplasma phocimorsus]
MSKNIFKLIDELVEQDKIEYKTIGELCHIYRGKSYSKHYVNIHVGEYPVYSSATFNNGEFGRIDTYDFDGEYMTWTADGYAGAAFYRNAKFSATILCGVLKIKDTNILNYKYLTAVFNKVSHNYIKGTKKGYHKLNTVMVSDIVIPVPPIEIQEKIARILDKFDILKAELKAELKARSEQYNYYRSELLNIDNLSNNKYLKKLLPNYLEQEIKKTEYKTIKDVCDIFVGKGIYDKRYVESNKGEYPVYSSATLNNGELGRINHYDYDGEYVTWTTAGKAGEATYRNGKFSVNKNCGVLKSKDNMLISEKFLALIFNMVSKAHVKGVGGMQKFWANNVRDIIIPIPPIEIQNTITNLLDKLQEYSQNIQGLLPQEAQLRETQYQYYLNRLLDFTRERER